MGDVTPYKVGTHQHVPEILQATGATSLSFTPLLAPMPRGILSVVTARPTGGWSDVRAALVEAYADEPFVHVLPDGQQPHTGATAGSNSASSRPSSTPAPGESSSPAPSTTSAREQPGRPCRMPT